MGNIIKAKYAPQLKPEEIAQQRETIKSSHIKLVSEYIERMRKVPNRPQSMQYFDEMANFFGQREKELSAFKESGGKIIGFTCIFAPIEFILAAGAIPVRIDSGFYDATKLGDRLIPVEVCPVIRSTIGAKMINLNPFLELCDVVISCNTCDGKTKLGELLSDYLPVWMVNLPRVKDAEHAKDYWLQEMKEIKRKIEDLTGTGITRNRLKSAISISLKATSASRRLQELRKGPPVITGRDAMLVNQILFYDDIKRWTEKTDELCNELQKRVVEKIYTCPVDTPRVLIAGAPMIWPDNWKIPNLIEGSNPPGLISADELCSGDRFIYDPVGIDELTMGDMLNAVSERYLLPCTCPCFTSQEEGNRDRVDRILTVVRDFNINGVIYHVLRGCHLYAIEYMRIRRILEQEKIPIYYLDTEYSREDIGQMKTRIEAFLEMLRTGTQDDDLY